MIYLNGKFMPIEEATVSVLDRGFIFGDGVYEVIPVYSRQPFRLEKHLLRLQHSLDGIRLKNPYDNAHWHKLLEQIIANNEGEDQYVYLHITRGVAKRDHAFPKKCGANGIYNEQPPARTIPKLVSARCGSNYSG